MGVFSIKRKDGTYAWYYDFMHNGIRYRSLAGTTKTQALRILEKRRTEIINGDHGITAQIRHIKIDEFSVVYLQRRKHLRFHKRDALSVKTLLKFFNGRNLMSICPSQIEDYIGKRMTENVSNGTINRELSCLRRMFSLAIKWGNARTNPVKEIDLLEEPPGRTRFLSEEEAKNLITVASDHLKPIIITALNTGMRLSEILSLKWSHVHIDNVIDPTIEIVETKNNKKRFIPINDDLLSLLQSIRKFRVDEFKSDEHVFLGKFGKPLLSVKNPFKRALKLAGISDFRFHDLRHTYASILLMSHQSPAYVQKQLGHSSTAITVDIYGHWISGEGRFGLENALRGRSYENRIQTACRSKPASVTTRKSITK